MSRLEETLRPSQPPLVGRRALVTGASGGVGRALAERLARSGVDCVLLARSIDGLEATAQLVRDRGRQAIVVVGDVTQPDDRRRAIDAARETLGGLDLLVNNAGVGAEGRFHESDPARLRSIFEVNFFAAAELTREALALLDQSDVACVACVGSVLAWCGAPQKSEYAASKFALRGWCDSVRPELARRGVHVLHASPSTIDSGFTQHQVERRDSSAWPQRRGVAPERVADRIVRGVARRQNEVAITWEDWGVVRLARYAPWLLDRVLNRYG